MMDNNERLARLTKMRNVIHGIVNKRIPRKGLEKRPEVVAPPLEWKQEHHPDLLIKALDNLEFKNLKDGGNNQDD